MSSSYSSLDWVLSHWAHFTVHRFTCFCQLYICHYCNTVGWTWWYWSLILIVCYVMWMKSLYVESSISVFMLPKALCSQAVHPHACVCPCVIKVCDNILRTDRGNLTRFTPYVQLGHILRLNAPRSSSWRKCGKKSLVQKCIIRLRHTSWRFAVADHRVNISALCN